MIKNSKVIAISPAYNLESSIGHTANKILKYVDELIIITDGSTDKTNEVARKTGAVVLDEKKVRGKGNAVRRGIEYSKRLNPGFLVLIDADGQHRPSEIPILLKSLTEENVDMVVGSRMMGTLRTSMINKVGNFGLKMISFLVTCKWVTDTESGFRAFNTKLYSLSLKSSFYEIESELFLRACRNKFKICEVPITVPNAVKGTTVKDGLRNGWYKLYHGLRIRIGLEQ